MKLMSAIKNNTILFFALIGLSAILYFLFAYHIHRSDFTNVFVIYAALFLLFLGIYQPKKNNFLILASVGILFRIIFIVAIPNLSQDFYRFIWDGRMLLNGFNPYLFTPESFIQNGELPINQAQELYKGMGQLNGSNFTNYPPINQLCFVLANLFSSNSILGSVIVMRIQIILADIGILYFGKKLLEQLHLPVSAIFLYFLNPFIIIELTGNLHFESVMLFFLVWSLYLLHAGKWKTAAVVLACSIAVKLIPLLFLPLFYQRFKLKQLIIFYGIILTTVVLLYLPFFNATFITNYTQSVGLWFKTFEFNASFYYLARAIGYQISGYNQIAVIGKIIPLLVISIILIITFFRENKTSIQLITAMLFSLSIYFFLSTTVHPWYVASLVLLSIFTKFRFALVWSFIIILSYHAYANNVFNENLRVVGLAYTLLFLFIFWEIRMRQYIFPTKKQ
ncbi:MAG: mannosyltransferase [Flavobacteriales bacterium CG18_big_fil_WC_8_21_14_2_50_32_9]|nr:MAG: mannosyltransferase [Flavobacteriales bacterium CG18_big_fil_WC_8_21_14_2_50_32_9]PJC63023.1 MAG: mannosyltransferase [Flavobacteriales bacterium CG_4_9_14_0_2_um_filter_32_27]